MTGIGRSGTTRMATLLAEASGYDVHHEEVDDRFRAKAVHPYSSFPIHRFHGKRAYGECHGLLRYSLSAENPNGALLVPHRAILYRDLRAVITSWMNRDSRAPAEFAAVAYEVSQQWLFLERYARMDHECRIFSFDEMMVSSVALNYLFSHLGFAARTWSDSWQSERINAGTKNQFEWTEEHEDTFLRITERLWCREDRFSDYIRVT